MLDVCVNIIRLSYIEILFEGCMLTVMKQVHV